MVNYAYGVINDNANSDGSFVFPVSGSSLSGAMGQTLPVVVETSRFTSELTLTNFSDQPKLLTLSATHDAIETEDHTASFGPLPLAPGQQFIIPNAIATARQRFGFNLPSGLAVPLFVTADGGDMSGIVIGARTGSPADPEDISKGQYSVFYTAVPRGAGFTDSAWVDGLQQNEENRSNLALVNTGEVDDSESVFSLEIYDGGDQPVGRDQSAPPTPRSRPGVGIRSTASCAGTLRGLHRAMCGSRRCPAAIPSWPTGWSTTAGLRDRGPVTGPIYRPGRCQRSV